MSIRRLVVPLAAAALLALPAAASAATRYVTPGGISFQCSQAKPCTLPWALLIAAGDGDDVLVAPGTYDVTGFPQLVIKHRIDVHGAPGAARPIITSSDPGNLITV